MRRIATALLLLTAAARPIGPAQRVVVVLSADAAPYQQALTGLRRALLASAPSAAVEVVALQGDTARVAQAVQTIRGGGTPAALVVTLGTLATRELIARVRDVPIVAGMILNPGELRGAPNATGVYLEYPVEVELDWLRRLLPDSRRIGVLYHGDDGSQRVAAARRIAAAGGDAFTVVAIRVGGPEDLPDALAQLTNRADVLWSLNDPVVYNPETARSLLLFSLRNRIPFVGQSAAWVRAGALYALDRDYEDVGAQCADFAARILGGESPAALAPARPRRVLYTLNRRTASELGFPLPDAVVRAAADVVN
ncbi:MAG TPA: ABC transporter substrate binding protein [Gemmatimonadales bacterium]|nr:ABC transporter substrate binding protein [Gemmatimonadales bacterium]